MTVLRNTVDGEVWAKEFLETLKDNLSDPIGDIFNEEAMTLWFNNAIDAGAMYESNFHQKKTQRDAQKLAKLKSLLILTDPAVENEQVSDLTAKQWNEYIKCFPEEG